MIRTLFSLGNALFLMFLCACGVVRETPKYHFADGHYTSDIYHSKGTLVYVENIEELLLIHPVKKKSGAFEVDTSTHSVVALPQVTSDSLFRTRMFRKSTFDFDFLTTPFKYRPVSQGFPKQFNTSLNGNIYLGYRTDVYRMSCLATPLGKYRPQTTHLGFSFGGILGIGGTFMGPSVTNFNIQTEYDGVVWTKGVAAIIGVNQMTIGLSIGADKLLSSDKQYWIYQSRPWFGLAFGLNLN